MFNFIKKWMGRKALYPIIFALILFINAKLGNPLTENQLSDIAYCIIAFILGEAGIDGMRIYVEKKK